MLIVISGQGVNDQIEWGCLCTGANTCTKSRCVAFFRLLSCNDLNLVMTALQPWPGYYEKNIYIIKVEMYLKWTQEGCISCECREYRWRKALQSGCLTVHMLFTVRWIWGHMTMLERHLVNTSSAVCMRCHGWSDSARYCCAKNVQKKKKYQLQSSCSAMTNTLNSIYKW